MIRDGKADMKEADCPDKLCVHQKAISAENESIVCLPDRVVVTVTNSKKKGWMDLHSKQLWKTGVYGSVSRTCHDLQLYRDADSL